MAIKIAGVDVINDDRELVLAKLTDINETINDTAVDVFIYDTSKDSDGGAWRHRTQHTSWYNEGASNIRGSRKEFPAVAVIVAEATKVTIYDGDDPSLPMWMAFTPNNLFRSPDGLHMLNGILSVAHSGSGGLLGTADFVADNGVQRFGGSADPRVWSNLKDRNQTGYTSDGSIADIVDRAVNDVAMTVLPGAPTDPATGLPVPTIAVATDGGVSVIKDDGTVVDITGTLSGSGETADVFFDGDNNLYFNSRLTGSYLVAFQDIPATDVATSTADVIYGISGSGYAASAPDFLSTVGNISRLSPKAVGGNTGLQPFLTDFSAPASSTVALLTSSYTTGWMNGDIKLAALADTTAETLSGSELVVDGSGNWVGDFDVAADVSSWSNDGTSIISHNASGYLDIDRNGSSVDAGRRTAHTQISGLTVGETYVVSANLIAMSNGFSLTVYNPSYGIVLEGDAVNATGSYSLTFVATHTSHVIGLGARQSTGATVTVDNVSVRLADPDRSVNGNGIGVHGTITKEPVATGADVVAYSGFSASNYLEQPYNSDLDFGAYTGTAGTGDFSVMGWVKTNSTGQQTIISRDLTKLEVYTNANGVAFTIGGTGRIGTTPVSSNTWRFFVVTRRSGVGYTYVDGALDGSVAATGSVDVSADTFVGIRENLAFPWTGSVALLRISATAPTADQIAKIYEDERPLFQPNAKATLTGSSDAVTALAHDPDTDLLHVGTSGGRSVFQGLRRVEEHTGTNSQSLAAISAVDGLVVEGK